MALYRNCLLKIPNPQSHAVSPFFFRDRVPCPLCSHSYRLYAIQSVLFPRLPAAAAFSHPPMQNMERDWAGELAGGAAGYELSKGDGQAREEGGGLARPWDIVRAG